MFSPGDKVRRVHATTFGTTEQGDVVTVKKITSKGSMTIQDEQPERVHDPNSYELFEKFTGDRRIFMCDDCSGEPCYLLVPSVTPIPDRCPFGVRKPKWRKKND